MHPPEFPFHQEGIALKYVEKAGSEPKKRNNYVVVTKTLDHIQNRRENRFAQVLSEGRLSARRISDSWLILFYIKLQISQKKFRLSRVAERLVKEHEKKGRELYHQVDKTVEVRMLCCANNSEVLQVFLKQTWNLLARKHGT